MSAEQLPYKDCAIAVPLTQSDFAERERLGAKNLFRLPSDEDTGAALIAFDSAQDAEAREMGPIDLDKLESQGLITITDPAIVSQLRIRFNRVAGVAQAS